MPARLAIAVLLFRYVTASDYVRMGIAPPELIGISMAPVQRSY